MRTSVSTHVVGAAAPARRSACSRRPDRGRLVALALEQHDEHVPQALLVVDDEHLSQRPVEGVTFPAALWILACKSPFSQPKFCTNPAPPQIQSARNFLRPFPDDRR